MAQEIANLKAVISVDTNRFRAGMASVDAQLARTTGAMGAVDSRVSSMGTTLARVGKFAAVGLGIGLAAAATSAIKMASDFETSMSRITALVGVNEKVVAGMSGDVKRLAATYGKSGTEAADAMFFITSAGLKGATAMKVLEASLKASAVGLGDTATIADLATSAMNAYTPKVLNAGMATDVLTATVREGKLQADELAGAMGRVLPVSSAMGVSFQEVGATFASMSRTGTNANEAATQLRGILVAILRPSKQAEDALAGMGTSSAELRKQIKEKGLLSTLKTLKERMGDNEEVQAQVFRDTRALTGVMDMLGGGLKSTERIFANMAKTGGDTDKAFKVMQDTMGFKMARAMAEFKLSLMELGLAFAPVLEVVIGAFEKVASALRAVAPLFSALANGIKAVASNAPAMAVLAGVIASLSFNAAIAGARALGTAMKGVAAASVLGQLVSTVGRVGAAYAGAAIGVGHYSVAAQKADWMGRAGTASISRFGAAGNMAKTAFSGLGRSLLSAFGGPVGIAIGATATLAYFIGGELISSFMGAGSAADQYAAAQQRATTETNNLRTASSNLVGSLAGAAQAQSAENAAKLRAEAANRAAAQAVSQYGKNSAEAKRATEAARDADVAYAAAMAQTDQARATSDEAVKKQIKGIISTGDATRDAAAKFRTSVVGQPALLAPGTKAWDEQRMKVLLADAQFMRTNKTVKDQQAIAARLVPQLKALGPQYEGAAKAADALAKAKTPEGYNKALKDLTTALGGTKDEASKAAGEANKSLKRMGAVNTAVPALERKVAGELDALIATVSSKVSAANAKMRNLGKRNSPDVAAAVTANLDNVNSVVEEGLGQMEQSTDGKVTYINGLLRKVATSVGNAQSLVGSFSTGPGIRDLVSQAADQGIGLPDGATRKALANAAALERAYKALEKAQNMEDKTAGKVAAAKARRKIATLAPKALGSRDALQGVMAQFSAAQTAVQNAFQRFRAKVMADVDTAIGADGMRWTDYVRRTGPNPGDVQIVAGRFTALQNEIDSRLKAVEGTSTLRSKAIEKALKGSLIDGLDRVGVEFEGRIRALMANAERLKGLQDTGNLTASEQALKDMEAQASAEDKAAAAQDRATREQEAQAKLREALRWGNTADEKAARDALAAIQKEKAQAERDQAMEDLRAKAQQEREQRQKDAEELQATIEDEADALRELAAAKAQEDRDRITAEGEARRMVLQSQYDADKAQAEANLNQMEAVMNRLPAILASSGSKAKKQADKFRKQMGRWGDKAGLSFANELAESLKTVEPKIVRVLASRVKDLLQLNSPAKKGPLSTIDSWWDAMPDTLASGVNPSEVNKVVQGIVAPEFAAAGGGGGGGSVTINLNVTDQTMAGMSREQADRVARQIKGALDRQVGITL